MGRVMAGRRSPAPARRAPGFTLIEMMVVMVLLGLLTTLALPAMQRWHDGVQARAQTQGVIEALRAAAFAAGANRRSLVMDAASFVSAAEAAAAEAASASAAQAATPEAGADAAVEPGAPTAGPPATPPGSDPRVRVVLPPGWRVETVQPAVFLANGLCRPGAATLATQAGARITISVEGPACAVALAPAPQTAGASS